MTTFRDFQGLDNVTSVERLTQKDLREATNVDLDATGKLSRREGYTQVNSGGAHSLWAHGTECFFVRGTELRQLNADYTDSLIASGLTLDQPVSFAHVNGETYWSNGVQKGVIRSGTNVSWGIPTPAAPTLSTTAAGGMNAGTYQVVVTFEDSSGREGGASLATVVEASEGDRLQVTVDSGLNDVAQGNIYITPTNGDQFYWAGIVTNASPSLYIANTKGYTILLRTQFLNTPVAGHLVRYFNGRLFIAQGSVLWYTEPLAYHLVDRRRNFFLFPQDIDVFEPVLDGLYVASDQTYFLSGTDPEEMQQVILASYGGVRGTSVIEDGSRIGDDNFRGPTALWTSEQGICAGGTGGVFRNFTEKRLALSKADKGAGLLREHNGIRQYIGLLKDNNGEVNSFAASDVAVAEVKKGGITV